MDSKTDLDKLLDTIVETEQKQFKLIDLNAQMRILDHESIEDLYVNVIGLRLACIGNLIVIIVLFAILLFTLA